LENVVISSYKLADTIFDDSNLANTTIAYNIMSDVSFKRANLRCFSLEHKGGSQDGTISFQGADLVASKLFFKSMKEGFNIELSGAKLNGARLKNARIVDQELKDTDFSSAKIKSLAVERVILSDCKFIRTTLTCASFSHCTFNRVVFDYSTFNNIEFDNCQFNNCNIRGVQMKDQLVFTGIGMYECTFEDCYSLKISFNETGAKFVKCNFIGESLHLDDTSDYFVLRECNFSNLELHMKLYGAKIVDCWFDKVSFGVDTLIKRCKIKNCNFNGLKTNGFELLKNTISGSLFAESSLEECKIVRNEINQTVFRDISFDDVLIEDNKMQEVSFEKVQMKRSSFLNNGGFTFSDSKYFNTNINKNIPGIERMDLSIKSKKKIISSSS